MVILVVEARSVRKYGTLWNLDGCSCSSRAVDASEENLRTIVLKGFLNSKKKPTNYILLGYFLEAFVCT